MHAAEKAEIIHSLRKNFLFASLQEDELEQLSHAVEVQELGSGEFIVRENERANTLFVVVSGGVNVTKSNGHFLAYLGPGGFFGEMGLFQDNSVRSANCVASADSRFLVVSKEVLDQFCVQYPATGLKIFRSIIRTLAERLQATSSDLAILMGTQVQSQSSVSKMVEEARNKKKKKIEP